MVLNALGPKELVKRRAMPVNKPDAQKEAFECAGEQYRRYVT